MNPLFSTSGYTLDSHELRILQKDGWVSISLTKVVGIKKPSFASAKVRFIDGRSAILDLSNLSTTGFSEVVEALQKAVHEQRVASAHKK